MSKTNITFDVLREHLDALNEKFGADAMLAYGNISMSQMSVARYYGGMTVNGAHYVYNPTDDSLIRGDVLKWMARRLKQLAKESEVRP